MGGAVSRWRCWVLLVLLVRLLLLVLLLLLLVLLLLLLVLLVLLLLVLLLGWDWGCLVDGLVLVGIGQLGVHVHTQAACLSGGGKGGRV